MPHVSRIAPILPVREVADALDLYAKLGFEVEAYDETYGFVSRDEVQFHVQAADVDPRTSMISLYLYVDDPDALFAQWRAAGVDGDLSAPTDRVWGLREGTYVDPDGNLLRFGSMIAAASRSEPST